MRSYSINGLNDDFTTKSVSYGGIGRDVLEVDDVIDGFDFAMYSEEKSTLSKLAVYGSSTFINDEHVEDGSAVVPFNLVLQIISWMYDSDINVGIPDKERAYDHMRFGSGEEATSVIRILYVAPIAVALIGGVVWLRRRSS